MKFRKSCYGVIPVINVLLLFAFVSPLICQTSNSENSAVQNSVVYYSLVPAILLQNIFIPASGSSANSTSLTSVACEITILRPSIRD
jgi:hypothetical protein